jgi:hypothetical protein
MENETTKAPVLSMSELASPTKPVIQLLVRRITESSQFSRLHQVGLISKSTIPESVGNMMDTRTNFTERIDARQSEQKKTPVCLSWGEIITTPPPFKRGWISYNKKTGRWKYFTSPPRVVLPKPDAYLLH